MSVPIRARSFSRDQLGALGMVVGGLLGLGLMDGTSGAVWPDVIDAFAISKGAFGIASGIGLTVAFPVLLLGGRLTSRFDKRAIVAVGALLLALSLTALSVGSGIAAFVVIMAVRGIGICVLDLSSNALAMEVESATKRHLMNPLHAGFSGGTVIGAGFAWLIFRLGGGYRAMFVCLAIALALFAAAGIREQVDRPQSRRRTEVAGGTLDVFRLFRRAEIRTVAALAAISFSGEIVIAQWIGIYLRDEEGHSPGVAVAAVVFLGLAMFLGRLGNAPLAQRVSPRRSLMAQGVILAVGGTLIVMGDSAVTGVIGCGIAGFGLAGVAPTAISLAGVAHSSSPGAASGAVLTGGYAGVALIPYVAGAVASVASVRAVLMVELLYGAGVVAIAMMLPRWLPGAGQPAVKPGRLAAGSESGDGSTR